VHRRLPAEGLLWEAGSPVQTPFFGVAEKTPGLSRAGGASSGKLRHHSDLEELKSIGGFAFCIEATESLSLVTSFFLQHTVDVSNAQDVQMWLLRFKQLDLRLIQYVTQRETLERFYYVVHPDTNLNSGGNCFSRQNGGKHLS
jgi:hypothetical protein